MATQHITRNVGFRRLSVTSFEFRVMGLIWCFRPSGLQYRIRLSITRAGHPAQLEEDAMKFKFERQAKRHLKQATSADASPTIQQVTSHKIRRGSGKMTPTKRAPTGRAHYQRAYELDPTNCRPCELALLADEDLDAA